MGWFVVQLLVLLILAFLLGLFVGWIWWRNSRRDRSDSAGPSAVGSRKGFAGPAAAVAASGTGSKPDDLSRIEGIGPQMSRALNAAGIHTFAQVASATQSALEAALERAGLSFAPSLVTWSDQADYLVRGDEAGFKKYTDYLVAGRDPATDGK